MLEDKTLEERATVMSITVILFFFSYYMDPWKLGCKYIQIQYFTFDKSLIIQVWTVGILVAVVEETHSLHCSSLHVKWSILNTSELLAT